MNTIQVDIFCMILDHCRSLYTDYFRFMELYDLYRAITEDRVKALYACKFYILGDIINKLTHTPRAYINSLILAIKDGRKFTSEFIKVLRLSR